MEVEFKRIPFTDAQYLAFERVADKRHELIDGLLQQVPNECRWHNLIKSNLAAMCHGQLRRRICEVYASNMRVKVRKTGLYTYPDVVVVCGKPQLEDEKTDTLLNPTVLIEVLSPSTEAFDRGDKFAHYRNITTLKDYILVSQSKMMVEHFVRQSDNTWLLTAYSEQPESLSISSIECSLSLEEIYEKVNFAEEE